MVVFVIAPRGDPKIISKQLKRARQSGHAPNMFVVLGPIFGSLELGSTPREYADEHPDTVVLEFILDMIKQNKKLYLLLPTIDDALIKDFTRYKYLISGSPRQKAAFEQMLKSNMSVIQKCCVSRIDASDDLPKIKRSGKHMPVTKELLALVPKAFWPSAYYIDGTLIEPLHARCYQGSGGSELCGFLACALSSSLREAKGNCTAWKNLFKNDCNEILNKYSDELKKIHSTYVMYDNGLKEGLIPHKRKLNFSVLKKTFFTRYYPNIERKLNNKSFSKKEVYAILDDIFLRDI